jgi:hypothetical protein
MSASRKLYRSLAERLKEVRPKFGELMLSQWRRDVLTLARVLQEDNSGFDKRRFLTAAGFTPEELAPVLD